LLMPIPKIHARCDMDGAMAIKASLSPTEAGWFFAWGGAYEDFEDDDPAEDGEAPEESEQLESGCRLEAYQPIEEKAARRMAQKAK
jgi:hypothetical protein